MLWLKLIHVNKRCPQCKSNTPSGWKNFSCRRIVVSYMQCENRCETFSGGTTLICLADSFGDHFTISVTSKWARWHPESSASRLFTKPFIQAQIKQNIKAPRQWPLCGEFATQMASNYENFSIWWRHHDFNDIKWATLCLKALTIQAVNKEKPTAQNFWAYDRNSPATDRFPPRWPVMGKF